VYAARATGTCLIEASMVEALAWKCKSTTTIMVVVPETGSAFWSAALMFHEATSMVRRQRHGRRFLVVLSPLASWSDVNAVLLDVCS